MQNLFPNGQSLGKYEWEMKTVPLSRK
jgi:hypothetical protein